MTTGEEFLAQLDALEEELGCPVELVVFEDEDGIPTVAAVPVEDESSGD